ncbi:MAG: NUDIX hydrolase [Haloarculaceae archaeon]
MDVSDRARRAVAAELARLERDHGAFEVVDKTWAVTGEWYDWTRDRTEAGAFGGAGVWLVGDDGRVLLVQREGECRWEEPGGKHEPGETFEETARREAREETGVEAALTGVAQAHHITVTCEDGDREPLEQLFVVFHGEHAAGEPRPREGEIETVRWWADHPERLHYEEIRSISVPAAES